MWWFFDGKQVGTTGNDGNDDPDYITAIDERMQVAGTGAFRLGASYGTRHSDFDQAYDSLSPGEGGGAGGAYTVRSGDTLASIAQATWGDASLWYMIADANGLTGAAILSPGQMLRVPTGLANLHNNAGTFRPYDAGRAIGDTSPTSPATPKPSKAKNKCGGLGAILLAVVAVAVTVATLGTLTTALGPVLGGAAAGAAGSVVSQTLGVATGIQDKFSFKGLALAAIGGGIGGAVGPGGLFGAEGLFGGGAIAAAARGALSSIATQGIGVATGLQKKFGWAGVAAAGVGAGVGQWVGGGPVASNAAAGIAAAAVQSLLTGDDFGDTLVSSLPGIIANTVGSFMERAIARAGPAENEIVVNQDAIDSATAGLPSSIPSIDLQAGMSFDQKLTLDEISGRITAERAYAVRTMRNEIAADIVNAQNAAGSSQTSVGRFLSSTFAEHYASPSSYSPTDFEYRRREDDLDALAARPNLTEREKIDLGHLRLSLEGDRRNLDAALVIADRAVIDMIGSVYGGVDFAKGGWRLAHGEVSLENGLSVGLGLAGAFGSLKVVGRTAAEGAPIVSDMLETGSNALVKAGRSGKQARLRELALDPKASSVDRGWINQEMNSIARGQRTNIRVPPGKVLAHRRGFEARNGFSYKYSDLQNVDLHKLQHKYEGY